MLVVALGLTRTPSAEGSSSLCRRSTSSGPPRRRVEARGLRVGRQHAAVARPRVPPSRGHTSPRGRTAPSRVSIRSRRSVRPRSANSAPLLLGVLAGGAMLEISYYFSYFAISIARTVASLRRADNRPSARRKIRRCSRRGIRDGCRRRRSGSDLSPRSLGLDRENRHLGLGSPHGRSGAAGGCLHAAERGNQSSLGSGRRNRRNRIAFRDQQQ